jgi:hypothetical protein
VLEIALGMLEAKGAPPSAVRDLFGAVQAALRCQKDASVVENNHNDFQKNRTHMIDWAHIRRVKFTTDDPPSEWPAGVRSISLEGVNLLGVDEKTGKLYWDGKEVLVRNKFALATYERVIAGIGVAIAGGGLLLNLGRAAGWWH